MSRAEWRPYLAGAGAILCWASLAAAVGTSLDRLGPELILFYGLGTAAGFLMLRDLLRRGRPLPPWPGWRVAAIGLYGIWGYHTLLVVALALAPDVEANILNYTWPLWIVLLGSLMREHRRSSRAIPGAIVGFAGAAWVIGGSASGLSSLSDLSAGVALGWGLALAAGFCWGSFTILIRRAVPPEADYMGWFCLLSAVAAGAVVWGRGVSFAVAPGDLAIAVYIGIVPLGLAFWLWERAAQGSNLQVLGLLSFLTPPLSVLLQALVLGEVLSIHHALGLALVLIGAAWGSRR